DDRGRHFSWPLPRELGRRQADRSEYAAPVPFPPTHGEPRFPAGSPDHGAGPVELVPAVRPQSADLRPQYFLGQAGGLPEGDATDLPRTRPQQLRGATPGRATLADRFIRPDFWTS